jgi:hypothetical protein
MTEPTNFSYRRYHTPSVSYQKPSPVPAVRSAFPSAQKVTFCYARVGLSSSSRRRVVEAVGGSAVRGGQAAEVPVNADSEGLRGPARTSKADA